MLKFIREWIWPTRHAALTCGAVLNGEPAKNGEVTIPPEIVAASENLNRAVTQLQEMAVDTKIQSDILHEQITGHPPASRD